ncbi:hypothetical protein QE152_g18932 [Popillia japonica]|uniref:Uncharacterized protein n=1 Tax=Popillia japonica TaxID=7064 RepID=A0AAW1L2E0_POPJA
MFIDTKAHLPIGELANPIRKNTATKPNMFIDTKAHLPIGELANPIRKVKARKTTTKPLLLLSCSTIWDKQTSPKSEGEKNDNKTIIALVLLYNMGQAN